VVLTAGAGPAGGAAAAGVDLAEQHIPRAPVVIHGIFAVSTVILVLLSALEIGGTLEPDCCGASPCVEMP
jgi:hypothetical protein